MASMIEQLRAAKNATSSTRSIGFDAMKKMREYAEYGGTTSVETEHVKRLFHYFETNADVHDAPPPPPAPAPAASTGWFVPPPPPTPAPAPSTGGCALA